MNVMKSPRASNLLTRRALALGLGCLLLTTTSRAVQFTNGDLSGSFDTTLSFGATVKRGVRI